MSSLKFLKPLPLGQKIRLGDQSDGGYVVYKKALDEADVLLTYGVGWDTSFEEDFNKATGKAAYMFDPTMFGKYMVNFKHLRKITFSVRLHEITLYLGAIWKAWRKMKALKKKKVFFVNEGIANKASGKYNTLDAHMQKFKLHDKQILLKIDIEGNEYKIFNRAETYRNLANVNQIILELHDLKNRLRDVQQMLERLGADYDLIHVHGNNCGPTFVLYDPSGDTVLPDTIEVTLVKRDTIHPADVLSEAVVYPVSGLDFPNDPKKKDYSLTFI